MLLPGSSAAVPASLSFPSYSTFVSLGFACFENILYVFSEGFGVAVQRAFLAVPGHACDGMFMGYFLGLSKMGLLYGDKKKQKTNLILSLVVPTISHGIYDYLLFVNNTEVYAKDITFGETTYVNIKTPYAAQFDKINYTVFYKRPTSNSWTQLNVSKDGTYKIKPTSKGEILVKVVTNAEFNNEMFTGVSSISTFTIS